MVLEAPEIASAAVPGQFVMVRTSGGRDPLLRRPISIAGIDSGKGTLTLICRIVGQGSLLLSEIGPDKTLDVMGPLGRGFDLSAKRPILVGGGIGLAPLLCAAEAFCPQPVEVLAGGRTGDEMFWAGLFEASCDQVHVTTDDGSMGICGTCADALPDLLATGKYDAVLACGPRPMMKKIVETAAKYKVPVQVSLEEHMACGLGACRSCTCNAPEGGSRQVCKDGPVFRAEEVDWT
jgi:dihydroorotate dehydrogenase electron transfer subunit